MGGFRSGLNPARWKGHLDKVLPAAEKISKTEHFAALPVSDMGAFMIELRNANGVGARALEFAILTAARSGEARGRHGKNSTFKLLCGPSPLNA